MNEENVLKAITAGLQARESQVSSASGYFVREIYHSGDQKFYDAHASSTNFTDERTRQAFMKNVMKPPLLTQYFCAAQGQSVRVDQRETFPDNWRHEITCRVGKKYLHWSDWGSSAKKEYLREARGMNFIEDVLQIAIDASTHKLTKRLAGMPVHYLGIEKIGDIETYKIQYRTKKWSWDVTEWIALAHGFLTIKKESRPDKATFENTSFINSRSVQVVDAISEVKPGIWMPLIQRNLTYATFKNQPCVECWETMRRFSVISLAVNEEIPTTVFQLPLPPGTRIGNSTFWKKAGLSHRTVLGNKAKFEAHLAQAKRNGEQPDLDSIDMSLFDARVAAGRPLPAELQDVSLRADY